MLLLLLPFPGGNTGGGFLATTLTFADGDACVAVIASAHASRRRVSRSRRSAERHLGSVVLYIEYVAQRAALSDQNVGQLGQLFVIRITLR